MAAALRHHAGHERLLLAVPSLGDRVPKPELASTHFPGWIKVPALARLPASSLLELALERKCSTILVGAVFAGDTSDSDLELHLPKLLTLLHRRAALQNLPLS